MTNTEPLDRLLSLVREDVARRASHLPVIAPDVRPKDDVQPGAFRNSEERPEQAPPEDLVRLAATPISVTDKQCLELESIHARGWPSGLNPAPATLKVMREHDDIFAGFDDKGALIATLHARRVVAESSVGALDVAHGTSTARTCFPPPLTDQLSVICHGAVTDPKYRGSGITQTLITDAVLPYLDSSPATKDLPWFTSSPLTYMVDTGRALVNSATFSALLEICDSALRNERPGGYDSLRDVIRTALPYLRALNFHLESDAEAAYSPRSIFHAIYWGIPTHAELAANRSGDADEQGLAAALGTAVTKLYSDDLGMSDSHRAAFVLFFLAATFVQVAYRAHDGRPADPILRFHFANGARLHESIGPIPDSRPPDVAAFTFGQVLVYVKRWRELQARHETDCIRRKDFFAKRNLHGIQVDLAHASRYVAAVMPSLATTLMGPSRRGRVRAL